jgi:hypothetical protein
MRLAAIADIHGNALALEAVLADIADLGLDEIVNLGDHVRGPLEGGAPPTFLSSAASPPSPGTRTGGSPSWIVAVAPGAWITGSWSGGISTGWPVCRPP